MGTDINLFHIASYCIILDQKYNFRYIVYYIEYRYIYIMFNHFFYFIIIDHKPRLYRNCYFLEERTRGWFGTRNVRVTRILMLKIYATGCRHSATSSHRLNINDYK